MPLEHVNCKDFLQPSKPTESYKMWSPKKYIREEKETRSPKRMQAKPARNLYTITDIQNREQKTVTA